MKLGFLKNNASNETAADAWDDPTPGAIEATDATPLLRTPAQTAAWILLRKPVWGTLAALLVIVLVISGAAFVKRNDSMSGTVSAAVKEVPRAATPKPSFEEDEQDPSMREEDDNTDPDEENEDEDPENDEENDENTDPDSSDENGNDTSEETPDTTPPDQYQEPPQTPTPSIPDGNTPPAPAPAPQPAIPTPGTTIPYKTATATRNIVCSPEATIRIEAVGTGTITLQATGAQPAQGQGRVSVEARGTQIQVSATSQSTNRAFVQFAWAWTQGGYCRQY